MTQLDANNDCDLERKLLLFGKHGERNDIEIEKTS